jgi:hypothetical protein
MARIDCVPVRDCPRQRTFTGTTRLHVWQSMLVGGFWKSRVRGTSEGVRMDSGSCCLVNGMIEERENLGMGFENSW